jgi:hypothetical protein
MTEEQAQKKRDYEREAYHSRKDRDAAAAAGLIVPPPMEPHQCLRCGSWTRPCAKVYAPPGEKEPRVCGAPMCESCGMCLHAHGLTQEEIAARDARLSAEAEAHDEAVAEAHEEYVAEVEQVHEFPIGTPPADKFGWVYTYSTVEGAVKVRATQELPEGYDALSEQEKAAVKRGEVIRIARRCYVTGCGRKMALCDHPVVNSNGKQVECGYANCFIHGCAKGHPPKSREERRAGKPASPPPKPKKPVVKPPRDKGGQYTDEQILEVRKDWEEGLSEIACEKKYGLGAKRVSQWRLMRRPDGTEWVKRPGGVRVEVIEDRPPELYQWLKDVKFKILSEEEGQDGWIPFDPWPAQRLFMGDRLNREGFVLSKTRRLGATTGIQVVDLYSWMWRKGPAFIHWVSMDLPQAMERLQEARDMLNQAELPDWQRDCMELGGKTSTGITFRTKKKRNTINVHAPSEKAARGLRGTDLLMDEAAWMPWQELIYTTFVGNLSDQKFSLAIVSSANADDVWFRHMLDNAEKMGLKSYLLDYRARPGRGEEWFEEMVARMGGDREAAEQEFMGKAQKKGNDAFDVVAMKRQAMDVRWIGDDAYPHRVYSHGIDQSGSGAAKTVDVIGDVSEVPAQVIAIQRFEYDEEAAFLGKRRTQQKAEWADVQALRWPGPVFLDSTRDAATAEYMQWMDKTMVIFRGLQDPKEVNESGIRCLRYPRLALLENAIKLCETGRVVVHEQFESLYVALKTARRYGDVEARKRPGLMEKARSKKSGKSFGDNVDELDAFLLFCLALTELGGGGNTGVRGASTSRKSGSTTKVWTPPKRRYW